MTGQPVRHTYAFSPAVSANHASRVVLRRSWPSRLWPRTCLPVHGRKVRTSGFGRRLDVTTQRLALQATCVILFGVVTVGSSTPAFAQAVTAPKNLRVTGVTDWTVALMWDAPKGKAPSSYVV